MMQFITVSDKTRIKVTPKEHLGSIHLGFDGIGSAVIKTDEAKALIASRNPDPATVPYAYTLADHSGVLLIFRAAHATNGWYALEHALTEAIQANEAAAAATV